jgi:uncharacterized membrane protein YqaE (UPF0057 family)
MKEFLYSDLGMLLLAIFLPPVAIFLKQNKVTKHFFINIVLCFLFFVPAIWHSVFIVINKEGFSSSGGLFDD